MLDERLALLRAEASAERRTEEQLRQLQEKVETLEAREDERLQLVVTEQLMAVHDRVSREVEGLAGPSS